MDLGLSGKVALITASSSGIGMNVAKRLAQEGADVVLLARSAEKLETLAATFRNEYGVRALPVVGSMLEASDHDRLFAAIKDEFGRLDIAILNTGRPPSPLRSALDETDRSRWHQSYDTLLSCVIEITQRAYPLMSANSWGRMIAITSASVHLAMPHHALSTVFRAGVEAYMKHLSSEIGKDGITVNCVAPALIDSSHREAAVSYSPEQTARRREMSAMKRLGTHEELASVVTFLASVPAGFVTGESIRVDGGMVTAALHR
ncbi:SDR family oxidoreductase [Rhizobium leguminosarum]|uniref:SDR family oxidoreductase n=1 Tax=Rhizobium leguminosarum TaxID=384 RepID=UPI000FEF529E|nr:SDR family oxidoreductase [Rhizobium leguminosarum]RWY79957.1 SDR family oxidoreductase [Rhizobium leguminosarum]